MATNWKTKSLRDLSKFLSRGITPSYTESDGIRVLNQKCIRDQTVNFAPSRRTDTTKKNVSEDKLLKVNDILINSTGEGTLGRVAQIKIISEPTTVDSHITILRPNPIEVDPSFLGCVVRYLQPEIEMMAEGSTGQTELSRTRLGSLEIDLPSANEQRQIASILGAFDEKIAVNKRMNATLEAMTRAFFQSWFVDFDPVRAKVDGNKPVGIGEATANLFPNAFQDSSLGHIPKGWEIRDLDKTADYLNGLALQKYPPGDGPTFPVIKIAQLRKGDVIGADRCGTELPKQFIVEDGDVLFSWSGSLEVELWCGGTGALNQHLFKVTSKEFPKWFYYLWTLHHLDEFRLIAASKATTMGHIQRSHITDAKVVVPPRNLLDAMTLTMSPIIDQLIANRIQSRTLASLRDTLLPKLLSGELSVENLQS